MIFKLMHKRTLLLSIGLAALCSVLLVLMRYDSVLYNPAYNNFLQLHDGEMEDFAYSVFADILHFILALPLFVHLFSAHRSTNTVYLLPRLSSLQKWFYIKTAESVFACFLESMAYHLSMLITYCILGKTAEGSRVLFLQWVTAVLFTWSALSFISVFTNILTLYFPDVFALILGALFLIIYAGIGYDLPSAVGQYVFINPVFITRFFDGSGYYEYPVYVYLLLAVAKIVVLTIVGSRIYKHCDHMG